MSDWVISLLNKKILASYSKKMYFIENLKLYFISHNHHPLQQGDLLCRLFRLKTFYLLL